MFPPKVVSRYQGHVVKLKFRIQQEKKQDLLVDSTNVDKRTADLCNENKIKIIIKKYVYNNFHK